MNHTRNLTSLNEGDIGNVREILATGSMRRRLMDLGLVEGTPVQCTQKSPYGDPVAYTIRGAVIALRCEDAGTVLIS